MSLPTNNLKGALRRLKKIIVWKKLFLFHIDPKI